jgi:site-specific DNA-methyltransferase (adenine-specific)
MQSEIKNIPLTLLVAHPKNPRISMREDVVAAISANLADGFDPAHALIVRPIADHYEILSGHHRHEAAKRAGIADLPCWVRDMDDEAAYMALVTSNSQGELSPLEIGMHALHCVALGSGGRGQKGGLSAYAEKVGKHKDTISTARMAAAVFQKLSAYTDGLHDKVYHLAAIHGLPRECWQSAVEAMLAGGWSAKETGERASAANEALACKPAWLDRAVESLCKACLLSTAAAKATARTLTAVAALYDGLPENVVLYRHEKTDETKDIDGREMVRMRTVPIEFDARGLFASQVAAMTSIKESDATQLCQVIRRRIEEESEASEKWVPLLTDAQQAEIDKHKAESARIAHKQRYTPELIQADVLTALSAMPSDHFDLICIDPPYNMDKADWDSLGSGAEFADWAERWLIECRRVLKDSGAIYVFGINRMLSHIQHRMDKLGFRYRNWITWDTIQGAGGGLWVNRTEAVLYYSKTESTFEDSDSVKLERHEENVREYKGKTYQFKNPSNVWRFPCVDDKSDERTGHPTQKPVELVERIVRASCPEGGIVLDCFIGSGTTGVASMKNRRRCVGVDMNAEYLDICRDRFSRCEVPAP